MAEKDYAERLAQATSARLSGEPLRFAVKRRVHSLPGRYNHPDGYVQPTGVYSTVALAVIDTHLALFEVQTFSTEDQANAAADVLNATRTESGADEIRQKIHPIS